MEDYWPPESTIMNAARAITDVSVKDQLRACKWGLHYGDIDV